MEEGVEPLQDYPEVSILKLKPHQVWPKGKRMGPGVLDKRVPLLDRATPISSMGSCFASEIRTWLISHDYNYLTIGEEAARQNTACLWGVVYNTFTMRQEFQRVLENSFHPLGNTRFVGPDTEYARDPYRKIPPVRLSQLEDDQYYVEFHSYEENARRILTEVQVFVLTLGLTEIWYDRTDDSVFYQVPSSYDYHPQRHSFRTSTYSENLDNLQVVSELMHKHNPNCKIILTVSPVPLRATFTDDSVIEANARSKATLLGVAREIDSMFDNVEYFPSYEMVTTVIPNAYRDDNIHVTREAVDEIMQLFARRYVRSDDD